MKNKYSKVREAIFNLAEEWNKKSAKRVPYQFITWLVNQLEKNNYGEK